MNKKLIGLILILISLIIGIIIIYLVFFYNPKPVTSPEPEPTVTPSLTTDIEVQPQFETQVLPVDTRPATTEELTEENSRQVAINFIQRYGTYSNQADLARLNDLKFFVTSAYLRQLSSQISKANQDYENYSSFMTRSISERNLVSESTRAIYLITTKRVETKGDGTINEFNQDVRVELVKESGAWLVTEASWQ